MSRAHATVAFQPPIRAGSVLGFFERDRRRIDDPGGDAARHFEIWQTISQRNQPALLRVGDLFWRGCTSTQATRSCATTFCFALRRVLSGLAFCCTTEQWPCDGCPQDALRSQISTK